MQYDTIIDQGLDILMGIKFKWSGGITVPVRPSLVDQIVRKWGTNSSEPAVSGVRGELSRLRYHEKDKAKSELLKSLEDSVKDMAFWQAVQSRIK